MSFSISFDPDEPAYEDGTYFYSHGMRDGVWTEKTNEDLVIGKRHYQKGVLLHREVLINGKWKKTERADLSAYEKLKDYIDNKWQPRKTYYELYRKDREL